ncbi:unnamed protein product [Closterium sp. NIES-54]
MGDLVLEDHVVEELVRSLEDIPIGVADVLTVLQRLCSEHDPKVMSAVLHHAQTYAHDDLPRLRGLLRLSMRPFEAARHYPLSKFPAVMQELVASFPKDEKEVVAIRAAHRGIDELVTRKHAILQPRTVQQQEQQEEQQEAQEQKPQEQEQQQQEQQGREQQEQEMEQEQQQAHGDLGWQQEQSEGAFLLSNGDGLQQQANGDVKWQADGHVKQQVKGDVQKDSMPSIQNASLSLLSFLGHLGRLASTVVKASDSYLLLNKHLAHMLQPSPGLDASAVPRALQEKFESLHSALACRESRMDAAWKQLCALQGQVEREVSHLQEGVRWMQVAAAEAEAATAADAEATECEKEEVQQNWGWPFRKIWSVCSRKPLVTKLSVLVALPCRLG